MGSLGRRRICARAAPRAPRSRPRRRGHAQGRTASRGQLRRVGLDAARRRHKRAARLDAGRAAWMQQHAALAQAARRFDDDEKATVPRDLSQIDELRTMVACLAQRATTDQAEARRRAAPPSWLDDGRRAPGAGRATAASLAEEEARRAVEDAVATMGRALREDDGGDDALDKSIAVCDDDA